MRDGKFLLGFVAGIVVWTLVLILSPSYCRLAMDAAEECERNLPRNQTCEITAIPKK